TPLLECVAPSGRNKHVAYFGYYNANEDSVFIPVSNANNFSERTAQDKGQPRLFEAGRQYNAFAVEFNGNELTWRITGPDGVLRTVTATADSTPCNSEPTTSTIPITPVAECVAEDPAGGYIAQFGYLNPNPLNSLAAIQRTGGKNELSPGSADQGQTITFLAGTHSDVFSVHFDGGTLTWTIDGQSAVANPATSPACVTQNNIGIADQIVAQGLPSDLVDERIGQLTSMVTNDPNLQPLRSYFQQKLALSADTSQPEQHVAIASAGNYRPWLGGQPLAPAMWPEFIAVGATLNDSSVTWSFSQDASVLAPGAGYPLSPILGANSYGAGTSFAAPIFSTLVGACATLPSGLYFDGVNPPISPNALTNSLIGTSDFAPLLCSINSAPQATDQLVTTDEDVSAAFTLLASDPDGDTLTYSVGMPSNGAITGTAPNLIYTPNPNFNGSDNFSYQVCDSLNECALATVTITVNAVNDAPITSDQSIVTDEDVSVTITLTGSDVDGDALTFNTTEPMYGVLNGTAPNLTYMPNPNFNGSDQFGFEVCDSSNACASAIVSLTVNPVNDAPTADNQTVVVDEDMTIAITLSGSDVDGDVLTFSNMIPTNGTITGTAPNLLYAPNPNYFGSDSFSFQVCDTQICATGMVSITVNPVNDAPVVNDQTVITNEDVPVAITLMASDVDGDTLSYSLGNPLNGILSGAAPNLIYTPNQNFGGADSFSVQVCDPSGACDTAVISITVNPVNDAPSCVAAVPSLDFLWEANHQMVPVTILGVTDIDGDAVTITITSIYQDEPTNGSGDGDTSPDAYGVGTGTANLRAERAGGGNGRIYHVSYTATDAFGAVCQGQVTVGVFSNQGAKGGAVDDGALYDSTMP
ncbi:MAG: tandem-95 repeat protein, partial [Anaerolineae bacterium]|nr:tandem-95 repeat protein [Anaerolineae bacterium]